MHARMAAAGASCIEEEAGARSPPAPCRRLEAQRQQLQEENGTADRLSEQSDASFIAAEQNRQQAAAGKLKKTAFKLFGGKRSICTLPSFFGGKNKGHGKGTSKKGLCKSKTHDGISDVGCEDAGGGRLRSPSDGGTDSPSPQLPSSQSALLARGAGPPVDFVGQSASLCGSSEGFEKKPSGDKSLFLPRPKKGLKGLFNSIRRHRKNKANEPEKTELQEWTSRGAVAEEQGKINKQAGIGSQETSEKMNQKSMVLPPERGENLLNQAAPGIKASLGESREGNQLVVDENSSDGGAATGIASSGDSPDVTLDVGDTLCVNATCDVLPDTLQPEYLDSDPPSVPSGDQLSLMFGDVTSLKSFDSFTGCGDIIAEPDIDSITESATSAGRSRDATKRSSCLVTYQGGGEEMAVPDAIEEYLQQMWEGAAKVDAATYETRLPELMTNSDLQGVNAGKQEPHHYGDSPRNNMDPLTPHSDQQESAPNSDEGYYDSNTPGPEDEAGDEEIKKDRLPRDSYSGDALYEFYEPDDVLMSPSHGNEPWFDRKAPPSETFGQFLDFTLSAEKDLVQMMGQKSEVMETEEERLTSIQKQLLYWEMQREPVLKHLDMLSKDQHPREKECNECKTRTANLTGKCPSCLGCEQGGPHALSRSLNTGISAENQDWRDLQEMLCPPKYTNGSCGPKAHGSCFIQFMENGIMLDSNLEHPALESYALSGLALEKSVTYPFYRTHGRHSCPPSEHHSGTEPGFQESHPESKCGPEQAVNFSQALVEFTSSGTLFSSLSESLGSSDSGSAFTQNLPALPTMVTFDIVDVEQEGEGEWEQHLEMNTDEDIAASFEAFDSSYVPKDSFAECDERMFPGSLQSSFQSNWGVASLPRCLRLQELSPPMPEPLSICRRSRSLDTESLEFELGSLQPSKNGLKPCELWSKWSSCKKKPAEPGVSAGQGSSPGSAEERESSGTLPWPGLQNVSYRVDTFPSQEAKRWDYDLNAPAFQSTWGTLDQPDAELPFMCMGQNSAQETARRPPHDGTNTPVFQMPRLMARPSSLPLQTPVESQEVPAASHRHCGDTMAKKLAWVLPLGDKGADLPPSFAFASSPDKPAMCKPADMMEGVPQFHCSNAEAFKGGAEHHGSSEANPLNRRAACWKAPLASCQNVARNVTVAK
ncbi:APC membrane recruitment protein 1 [Eublepharis macularius]|uniref:APC membrane recruitment protein 1 n=1 Tax=Eublepharis macularius TaxID=481883 RepID=A0AA97KBX0_EUBMA|nr:APC membrane recruitment protein 1 [Eublepharis macularius]